MEQDTNYCDEKPKKMKILALHGYRQNADAFKMKTGSFRKIFHKFAEFTHVTAPHKVILVHDIHDLDETNEVNIGQSRDEGEFHFFFLLDI